MELTLITRQEAARRLGIGLRTLDRYAELGVLKKYTRPTLNGRSWHVRLDAKEVEKLRRSLNSWE